MLRVRSRRLFTSNGDGSVKAFLNHGLTADVTLDANGVYEVSPDAGWYKLLYGKKIRVILTTLQYQIGAQACPYFLFL